jgi:hypothetical protein
MGKYVGSDVLLKETSRCVADEDGSCVFEGKVGSE